MNSQELNEKINFLLDEAGIFEKNERYKVEGKLRVLYIINEKVFETVNVKMLTSEYDDLNNVLSMLTVYPKVQNSIVKLSPEQYKFFVTVVNIYDNSDLDWIGIAEDILNHIHEYYYLYEDTNFKNTINNLYEKNIKDEITEVEEETINKIVSMVTNRNIFDIESYNEIQSFNATDKFEELLIGQVEDEEFQKSDQIDKYKHVILMREFGHGLDDAKVFLNRYGDDYNEIIDMINNETDEDIEKYVRSVEEIDDEQKIQTEVKRIKKENITLKNYLTALRNIEDMEDLETLQKLYFSVQKDNISNNQKYMMDSVARKFFAREKNKNLYQIKESDNITSFLGFEDINLYMIEDETVLSITSLSSYSESLDWDCKLLENHGACFTSTASNNLGTAPIYGVVLGCNKYNEKSLLASAPFDLGSDRFVTNMNIAKAYVPADWGKADIKFHITSKQIDNTRTRHNEDVRERRELDPLKIDLENEKTKMQPAYGVCFAETKLNNYLKNDTDEILTSENLRKNINFLVYNDRRAREFYAKQYLEHDTFYDHERNLKNRWECTAEEVRKRKIKNVVIEDRTYKALKCRLRIDQMEKEIVEYDIEKLSDKKEMQNFLNLIERTIVESENCRAGNSMRENSGKGKLIHEEIRERLFSTEIMADRLQKIEKKIEKLDPEKAKLCYQKLRQITAAELEKYEHQHYFEEDQPGYDLEEYMQKMVKKEIGKDTKDIMNVLNEIDNTTGKTGGQIVCEAIEDIKELDEYESTTDKIHGRKHINNVILFSYLIGKNENKLNGTNLDLLVQAAKFHDVGRDGKWNGLGDGNRHDYDEVKHAEPGALGAEFYLKKELNEKGERKYTDKQIAMIQVAISYHEVSEKNKNKFNINRFEELCEKYGVDKSDEETTKLICSYLKDADAIDRTRFMWEKNQEQFDNIPDHRRYEREFYDNLNVLYLRNPVSIALVDKAREINKEYLKKGCEYIFDENGNFINDPSTQEVYVPDVLKPYEKSAKRQTTKYKEVNNKEKIKEFLQSKKDKEIEDEQKIIFRIATQNMDKSLLAKLRALQKKVLENLKTKSKGKNEKNR